MSSRRQLPFGRIVLGVFITVALLLVYRTGSHADRTRSSKMSDRSASGPIAGLEVSLKQTSTSPPTVRVAVENKNSHPVTVVSYDSPLDDMALRLGIVSITPAGQSEPVELPILQVRRMWPPPSDALITIPAGKAQTNDIVLKGPGVPEGKLGTKPSIRLSGRWSGVWAKDKDNIGEINLGDVTPDPDVHVGSFSTDALEVNME